MTTDTVRAVRLRPRSAVALALVSTVGVVAFGWPLLADPGSDLAHAGDAPLLFALLLPLLLGVLLAEIADGGLDAKAVALLGVLAAAGAALRPLGGGITGFSPVFLLIILGGRVLGRGFGFLLGAITLFASALLTGGVGPWLPFQMLGAAWVGFGAGCLPPARGRREVWLVATYGAFAGIAYGFLLNLWFWPFTGGLASGLDFVAGDPLVGQPRALPRVLPRDLARLRPGASRRARSCSCSSWADRCCAPCAVRRGGPRSRRPSHFAPADQPLVEPAPVRVMEVVLLGTGSADGWPNPFCGCASCRAATAEGVVRGQTAALVDDVLLLDCGPEAPRAAVRAGRSLDRVRDVLLTHSHPDHTGPSALLWRSWAERGEPLTVHGPAAALDACRDWVGPDDPVRFHPVEAGERFRTDQHTVRALAANHGDPGSGAALLWEVTVSRGRTAALRHRHRLALAGHAGRHVHDRAVRPGAARGDLRRPRRPDHRPPAPRHLRRSCSRALRAAGTRDADAPRSSRSTSATTTRPRPTSTDGSDALGARAGRDGDVLTCGTTAARERPPTAPHPAARWSPVRQVRLRRARWSPPTPASPTSPPVATGRTTRSGRSAWRCTGPGDPPAWSTRETDGRRRRPSIRPARRRPCSSTASRCGWRTGSTGPAPGPSTRTTGKPAPRRASR